MKPSSLSAFGITLRDRQIHQTNLSTQSTGREDREEKRREDREEKRREDREEKRRSRREDREEKRREEKRREEKRREEKRREEVQTFARSGTLSGSDLNEKKA